MDWFGVAIGQRAVSALGLSREGATDVDGPRSRQDPVAVVLPTRSNEQIIRAILGALDHVSRMPRGVSKYRLRGALHAPCLRRPLS